ncbi:MAG TPA: DHHW family protein [Thermoclostridium sp.]|nr:hypothetical protein [Clostridiaceae bacterium]HOQ75866.1 DHHW family protein [Thermoclostridium sp.]
MKKLRLDAIAFIVILGGLGLANLLNFNKPTVSALENRMLKARPSLTWESLFSGDYFRDYEDYYSDTFLNRDSIVKICRDIKDSLSLNEPGVTLVVTREQNAPVNQVPEATPTQPPQPSTPRPSTSPGDLPETQEPPETGMTPEPTPTPTAEPPREFGDDETVAYYLIVDGKAVQLFKFSREGMDYYAEVLNKYHEVLGDKVTLYSVIPPTNSEFVKLRKYADITDSQNDAMDYLRSRLDPGIVTVNVYDALNRHKDEYIYFKTDHHWTALGAYYGYCAFMDATGMEPVPLDRYETAKVEGYLGSSYTKTLNKELEKNPDTIYLYLPFTNHEYIMYSGNKAKTADLIDMSYAEGSSDKYLIFMSTGGATWSVIKTDVHNGKKILVMKDSFGNAWVPFLLPHYEEIYVVDARFYSKSSTGLNIPQFIEKYGIQELVFLFYMEDVNWTKFMNGVENHLN